jgi:lipid II:glycine glycyltransferase (peptidoglycan interpeptide bridge formation enzyme)
MIQGSPDSLDEKEWNEYLASHPSANVFQTPEMHEVYKRTNNYQPVFLTHMRNRELGGILLAHIINESSGLFKNMTARCVVQGGPLVSGKDAIEPLMGRCLDEVGKRCIYSDVRNLRDTGEYRGVLERLGYAYEDHINYIIDIDRPEVEVLSGFDKGRRKGIRRAEKSGLDVKEIKNKDDIGILYELLKHTYSKIKIPVADASLFTAGHDVLKPKNMSIGFLAYYKDECIAGRVLLCYKDTIYDWYAGALDTHRDKCANELLVWHALKWGMEHNYKRFDFGGAGNPNEKYGPREFKRRFNGELVGYGRYKMIHKPAMFFMSKQGLKIWRKFA